MQCADCGFLYDTARTEPTWGNKCPVCGTPPQEGGQDDS